jgi:hypothetical protein
MGIWTFFCVPERKGKPFVEHYKSIHLLSFILDITPDAMDAFFANSCCRAVWAGIRRRPTTSRADTAETFSMEGEKEEMDVTVEHVECRNQRQEM